MSEIAETSGAALPRRRRDAAATREALLAAARQLMSERGVAGTSTRDIAALAGVNQTLVYRYFGSKEKLVGEAAGGGGGSVDIGDVALADVPRVMLDDMLDRSEVAAERDGTAFWTLVGGANEEVVQDAVRERIESVFTRELADRLPGDDPALRAEMFSALLVGLAFLRAKVRTPAVDAADRETLARYVDEVASVLFGEPR